MKHIFLRLKQPLRNERGEITFFACFFVVGIVMLISFLLLYASIRITCINIRNGAKMELNNLSGTIYADTYRSQRETNFEEYLNTLYSSNDYIAFDIGVLIQCHISVIKLVNAKHTDAAGTAIADQLLRLLFTPLEGGLRISGAQICQNTMVGVANQQFIGAGAAQVRDLKTSCLDAFCMEPSGALLTLAMPFMVKIVPLSKVGGETNEDDATPPNRQPVDPRIWYETQGRSVLEALISDLNSRGHSKLTLREDGDICIEQGEDAVSQEHLNNFPQKVYWPRLAEVLESNGLAAEVTAQGIQVSW